MFLFHTFRVYFHMIAMMGTNTQYLQSGLELHAEFSANTTMKFDARINMKEKNVKIETLPCHQEVELAAVRYRRVGHTLLVVLTDCELSFINYECTTPFQTQLYFGIHMKHSILFFIAHLSPVLKMVVVSKIRRCYLLSFYHLHRSEAYAISRNMEEVDSEKKSPILPNGEMPTVSNQHFQSSEIFSKARSWEVTRPVLQAGREQTASQIPRESLQGSAEFSAVLFSISGLRLAKGGYVELLREDCYLSSKSWRFSFGGQFD